jgi:Domain of unknown function DUF11
MQKLLRSMLLPALVAGSLTTGLISTSPARASVTPLGQQGCPNGQAVSTTNLVVDESFAQAASGNITFETELPNRGPGVYPSDAPLIEGGPAGGGFSIQTGNVSYQDGSIVGRVFGGDPAREVPPSNTFFYSNPNVSTVDPSGFFSDGQGYLWRQTVPVAPNTTYNFYAYFDNLLIPDTGGYDPVIELRVDDPDDGLPAVQAGDPITVTKSPDIWVPIQYAFLTSPTQTRAVLEIWDVTGKFSFSPAEDSPTRGDDFAMVGINLRQCASAIGVAKAASEPVLKPDGSYDITYTITVRNYGSGLDAVNSLQVTDILTRTFANAGAFEVTAMNSSPNVTLDQTFTGRSPNTRLLAGNDTLDSGESATITFTVNVTPGEGLAGRGPFPNRALVTAISGNISVEDDSVPGASPDTDGNNNPKDTAEDRDTMVSIGTNLGIPMIITR